MNETPAVTSDHPSGPGRTTIALAVLVVVILWALNFIAGKIALRNLPSPAVASFRVFLGAIAMIPAYLICSRMPSFADALKTRSRGFHAPDLWTFFYLGFFGVVINQMCFAIGLNHTSVSHGAVIVGMAPIYTLALAVIFRLERATFRKLFGIALAFAGIAILAGEHGMTRHSASLEGDAIMMAGAIGFAVYSVLGKRVADRYDALTMTAFNHFTGAVVVLPIVLYQIRWLLIDARWRLIPWQSWTSVLYMAVFSSAVAYVLYFWLLKYLYASQLAAFTYLLPIVATILGIVWLGERGTWMEIVGGALALAGVYWIQPPRES
ncbi:MAG TPA: DMT family transporter [Candidatus Eremiobacteraceae bacterium]|nr:DMT family transporter [Candidatus Eremiobacteraceae bacterium]